LCGAYELIPNVKEDILLADKPMMLMGLQLLLS